MHTDLEILDATPENLGPCMSACTALERGMVRAYIEHPNYSVAGLAKEAGSTAVSNSSLNVIGWRIMHSERFLAAVNEEAGKRLRMGGLIGINVMMEIAQNPQHKDRLKAAAMLANRTGFHELSEHKVTVTDERPQSNAEMRKKIAALLKEEFTPDELLSLTHQPGVVLEGVTDAEFVEIKPALTAEDEAAIALEVEDL